MRFNKQELHNLANASTFHFVKEGVLLIRERHDSLFRRSEANVERWFRLKGNLLFYMKNRESFSEPVGVFVLERFEVRAEPGTIEEATVDGGGGDDDIFYPFQLVFESGTKILLAASSESERLRWIEAIQTVSYTRVRAELVELRKRYVAAKKQFEYVEMGRLKWEECGDDGPGPQLELALACDNLLCDLYGRKPTTYVRVYVFREPNTWLECTRTETIAKSSNPSFLVTAEIRASNAYVKLAVFNVLEPVTQVEHLLGSVLVEIEAIRSKPYVRVPLKPVTIYGSPMSTSSGFITILAWQPLQVSVANAALRTPQHPSAISPDNQHRRTYSLPAPILTGQRRQPRPGTGPPSLRFAAATRLIDTQTKRHRLFSGIVEQSYKVQSGLGGDLFVREAMAESRLCFRLPLRLLDIWMERERGLIDEISLMGQLQEPWDAKQIELYDRHSQLLTAYTQAKANITNYMAATATTECNFKASKRKTDQTLEFVPVNLHLQRLSVWNEVQNRCGRYDVHTVGVFAAHCQKSKNGGLLKLLKQQNEYFVGQAAAAATATTAVDDVTSFGQQISIKIGMLTNSIDAIRQLRKELSESMRALAEVCTTGAGSGSATLLKLADQMIGKSKLLLSLWDVSLVNEAIAFADRNRARDPPKNAIFSGRARQSPDQNGNEPCDLDSADLTQLTIEASVISLASKIRILAGRCGTDSGEQAAIVREVERSMDKLQTGIDRLLQTARLTRAIFLVQQDPKFAQRATSVQYRRDVCFAQSLTALSVALMTRLWTMDEDRDDRNYRRFLTVLGSGTGPLASFECLLSLYGDEIDMFGDMTVAVEDLRTVLFQLVEVADECPDIDRLTPKISGFWNALTVQIPVTGTVLREINELRGRSSGSSRVSFTVTPVLFNIGVYESAVIAETLGLAKDQDRTNSDSFERLTTYYEKFVRQTSDPDAAVALANDTSPKSTMTSNRSVRKLLERLRNAIRSSKKGNVEILQLSSEIARKMSALRFTSCKSAKDRTAMSVTLEQASILLNDYQLADFQFQKLLDCMRSEGCRRRNTQKNIDVGRYAINSLQLLTMPKLYRPPYGTYGPNVVS